MVSATVLVVDDAAAVLAVFRRLLEAVGAEVLVADGPGALSLLAVRSFDLVICDLEMPGADGVQVLEAARRACPAALRVLMSGNPASLEQANREGSPAELRFGKPVPFAVLLGLCKDAQEGAVHVRSVVASMERLYSGSAHSAFVKDTAGRYLFMSAAGAALLGRPVREVIGNRDSAIFERGTFSEEVSASDAAVLRTGKPCLYLNAMRGPEQARVFLSAKFPVRDGSGRTRAIGCLSPEVTAIVAPGAGDGGTRVDGLLRELNEAAGILAGGGPCDELLRSEVERCLAGDAIREESTMPAP